MCKSVQEATSQYKVSSTFIFWVRIFQMNLELINGLEWLAN